MVPPEEPAEMASERLGRAGSNRPSFATAEELPGAGRDEDSTRIPSEWGRYDRSRMRYLIAAGIGILGAIATAVLWVLVRFVLPITLPFLISRTAAKGSGGVGSAGAVIGTRSILLAALIGFVGAFLSMLWRR